MLLVTAYFTGTFTLYVQKAQFTYPYDCIIIIATWLFITVQAARFYWNAEERGIVYSQNIMYQLLYLLLTHVWLMLSEQECTYKQVYFSSILICRHHAFDVPLHVYVEQTASPHGCWHLIANSSWCIVLKLWVKYLYSCLFI